MGVAFQIDWSKKDFDKVTFGRDTNKGTKTAMLLSGKRVCSV